MANQLDPLPVAESTRRIKLIEAERGRCIPGPPALEPVRAERYGSGPGVA